MVLGAYAQHPAERQDGVGDVARDLLDDHVLDLAELLAGRVDDVGPVHAVGRDQRMGRLLGGHGWPPCVCRKLNGQAAPTVQRSRGSVQRTATTGLAPSAVRPTPSTS